MENRNHRLLQLKEFQRLSQNLKADQHSFYSTKSLLLLLTYKYRSRQKPCFFIVACVGPASALMPEAVLLVETSLSALTFSPVPLHLEELCQTPNQGYKHLKDYFSSPNITRHV